MSIRNFLVLLLPVFLAVQLHAQTLQDDLVYLNNGTFLRGKITEQVPGKSIRILVGKKDTLLVPITDIKMMRKEDKPTESEKNYENGVKAWGYTFMTDLSFGLGKLEGLDRYMNAPESHYSVGLSVFNGVTITPYIQLGISAGLEMWNDRSFLPVYLDLRANILRDDNTPFIYVNTGYALGWQPGEVGANLGGALAGLGIGAKFRIVNRRVMSVSLGYHFQQTHEWQISNAVKSTATRDSHFVLFRMGLAF